MPNSIYSTHEIIIWTCKRGFTCCTGMPQSNSVEEINKGNENCFDAKPKIIEQQLYYVYGALTC